jgi:exosortase F-associated protein
VNKNLLIRVVIGSLSLLGLVAIFIFQGMDVAAIFGSDASRITRFILNRTLRFLLNDLCAIGLIFALFAERKYIIFSLWVQLAGVFLFLIPYFILKLNFPSYNGPLISYLHRLILNPTLLLLLIPAFYYQKRSEPGLRD